MDENIKRPIVEAVEMAEAEMITETEDDVQCS